MFVLRDQFWQLKSNGVPILNVVEQWASNEYLKYKNISPRFNLLWLACAMRHHWNPNFTAHGYDRGQQKGKVFKCSHFTGSKIAAESFNLIVWFRVWVHSILSPHCIDTIDHTCHDQTHRAQTMFPKFGELNVLVQCARFFVLFLAAKNCQLLSLLGPLPQEWDWKSGKS